MVVYSYRRPASWLAAWAAVWGRHRICACKVLWVSCKRWAFAWQEAVRRSSRRTWPSRSGASSNSTITVTQSSF